MFTLYFVITMLDGSMVKEHWPDRFSTHNSYQQQGIIRANILVSQVIKKYPNMSSFEIQCDNKYIDV